MSLILDALKKLEQDKAARRGKSVEIGPAILKGKPRRSSIRPLVVTLAAVAVVAAAAFAVKSVFFSAPSSTGRSVAQKEPAPPMPAPVAPPAPATTTPAPALPEQTKPLAAAPAATPQPQSTPAAASSQPQGGAAPANLKVTGIAWQDERRSRRAVVNGMLVGEGAFVGGAWVTEIRLDRVRFTMDGQEVSVPLLTPLNAEPPADKGTGAGNGVAAPVAPAAATAAPPHPAPAVPTRPQRPRRHHNNPNDE